MVNLIDLLILLSVVGMIFSIIAMSNIAKANKTNVPTWFVNIVEVYDYVELTRKQNGRVGLWFWVLVASVVSLATLVIVGKIVP